MDKKNTTIGVLLLVAAFVAYYMGQRLSPPPPKAPEVTQPSGPSPLPGGTAPAPEAPAISPSDATFAALATARTDATITTLANDHVTVQLTDFGGAVLDVALKHYAAHLDGADPYIFNETHTDPILSFAEGSFPGLGRDAHFQLVSKSDTEAVYRAVFENRIEVTRRYMIRPAGATDAPAAAGASPAGTPALPGDPYQLRHETTFRNLTQDTAPLPRVALALGTASLVSRNDAGLYLNTVRYDGEDTHYTDRNQLEGGGFMSWFGVGSREPKASVEDTGPAVWGAVKNQFFASIFEPDAAGVGIITRRVTLPPIPGSSRPNIGVTGAMRIDLPTLPPGGTATVGGTLYVGPKEYTRLAKLDHNQDRVMQFDRYFFNRIFFSGYVAPFMNTLMNWMHGFTANWGLAIVLMTILLKVVSLPFTLAAAKSAKRMQKIQPHLQAIREKYKDQPQKLNQATMEVFKEHRINPAGGCLPVLITIPLFVGFFAMLQGTAELRFQSFLWAEDLSAPDTVLRIFGFPLNIMPLLMGATMVFQMRLTPTPTVDNAQARIFKFMPLIFTAFCYNFSCALALYSTINGLFTIGQQLVINRMKDKEPAPGAAAPAKVAGKRPLKNVTPRGK